MVFTKNLSKTRKILSKTERSSVLTDRQNVMCRGGFILIHQNLLIFLYTFIDDTTSTNSIHRFPSFILCQFLLPANDNGNRFSYTLIIYIHCTQHFKQTIVVTESLMPFIKKYSNFKQDDPHVQTFLRFGWRLVIQKQKLPEYLNELLLVLNDNQ